MNSKKTTISGTGCALADLIYNGVSFDSTGFGRYLSKRAGDGGLSPGKLVFTEELESFSKKAYLEILKDIIGDKTPDVINVGGPSLVSMILASQILDPHDYEVRFFGIAGKDNYQQKIFELLKQTPLGIENYKIDEQKTTPTTDVFSDPGYDNGHGERTFVNNIGAAWDFDPQQLNDGFFDADIHCYGGTALVPPLHDNLSSLLKRSKRRNNITVVNTVFDFRNQKRQPDQPWPLVDSVYDYRLIDILIMDHEEALRISGKSTIEAAAEFFSNSSLSSFIITNGAKDLLAYSSGTLFSETGILTFPTSRWVRERIKNNPERNGDTTGCGDNFAGGVIASLATQLKHREKGSFDLSEAVSWGVSAGGNCCFTVGGTYIEEMPGELIRGIQEIQKDYITQIGIK